GYRCRTYLFVYNRGRRGYPFHGDVEAAVAELVAAGVCDRADVWDLDRLVREHQVDVLAVIDHALQKNSRRMLEQLTGLFDVGDTIITEVPLSQKRLDLRRGEQASITLERPVEDRCVGDLLVDTEARRWSILIGEFGTGKSTAALHAAVRQMQTVGSSRHILYAEARLFDTGRLVGLHGLLGQMLHSARLPFDTEPEATGIDRDRLIRLAVPLLKEAMARPDAPYLLIIDGLDENKAFSTTRGIVGLNNSLVELGCPAILITRREHFIATFENFNLSLNELAQQYGSRRAATLFELHRWEQRHILGLLDLVLTGPGLDPAARGRLLEFRALVMTGETRRFYADLPSHPLFLRFILDDVVADGIQGTDRCRLLERWLRRKIEREMTDKGRGIELAVPADAGSVVEALMAAMEMVAVAMISGEGGAVAAGETLPVEGLTDRLGRHLEIVRGDVSVLLLNTVLIPVDFRGPGRFRIAFAFMIFRDFFLARHLCRIDGDGSGFPQEAQSLLAEMRARPEEEGDGPILL
ncbi:MAG: hypothetical protein HQL34_14220, partial [Alphaproteobacteria bacterium]|nr:hypothetical protein [Alphaproteobacteria bacterium]